MGTEDSKTQILIEGFKLKFNELMQRFEDKRKLEYKVKNEDNLDEPFIRCLWTEEIIKIGVWPGRIALWLEKTPIINQLDLKSLKKFFIQSARHEYGHTVSFKSFYLDFPEEIQEVVSNNELTYTKEYEDLFEKTEFHKIDNSLSNVDLKKLKSLFVEFIANYSVYDQIEKKIPKICLKLYYMTVNLYLECVTLISLKNINKNNYILDLVLNIHIFYIFKNNWEQMKNLFEKYDKITSLEIFYNFCEIFERIFKGNTDYINMKKDVIDFGKFLNSIRISDSLFTEENQENLKRKVQDYLQDLTSEKSSN